MITKKLEKVIKSGDTEIVFEDSHLLIYSFTHLLIH